MNAVAWLEAWSFTVGAALLGVATAAYEGDLDSLGLHACLTVISVIMWFDSLREVTK